MRPRRAPLDQRRLRARRWRQDRSRRGRWRRDRWRRDRWRRDRSRRDRWRRDRSRRDRWRRSRATPPHRFPRALRTAPAANGRHHHYGSPAHRRTQHVASLAHPARFVRLAPLARVVHGPLRLPIAHEVQCPRAHRDGRAGGRARWRRAGQSGLVVAEFQLACQPTQGRAYRLAKPTVCTNARMEGGTR